MDSDELLALEAQMRAPDAVMEPGMADVVGAYMRAGGKPEDVIESLTAGYEGARLRMCTEGGDPTGAHTGGALWGTVRAARYNSEPEQP